MGLVQSSTRQERFLAGSYHTDGRRLLRIVCEAGEGAHRAVEDCKTMEVTLVALHELEALDLKPVAK
jgi:hypothetical protein